MNNLNQKQIAFQLSNAMMEIFTRYVLYNGQVEKFVDEHASELTDQFSHFVDHTLLKRPEDNQ